MHMLYMIVLNCATKVGLGGYGSSGPSPGKPLIASKLRGQPVEAAVCKTLHGSCVASLTTNEVASPAGQL
jgi:hypothetical protein